MGDSMYFVGDFFKRRGIFDHLIVNTRKLGDKTRYPALWIDEALVGVNHLLSVVADDGDFGNTACGIRTTSGFNINDCKHK